VFQPISKRFAGQLCLLLEFAIACGLEVVQSGHTVFPEKTILIRWSIDIFSLSFNIEIRPIPSTEIRNMASSVDWYYHRKGCVTCQKMDALLAELDITPREVVSANKIKLGVPEALELVGQCTQLVVSKGTKAFEIDLKKTPKSAEELQALIIGPTGNLRAPTIRRGKTLFVGFQAETFTTALGGK
jgi:arsenate reductase-like glutaredoxin family protein